MTHSTLEKIDYFLRKIICENADFAQREADGVLQEPWLVGTLLGPTPSQKSHLATLQITSKSVSEAL